MCGIQGKKRRFPVPALRQIIGGDGADRRIVIENMIEASVVVRVFAEAPDAGQFRQVLLESRERFRMVRLGKEDHSVAAARRDAFGKPSVPVELPEEERELFAQKRRLDAPDQEREDRHAPHVRGRIVRQRDQRDHAASDADAAVRLRARADDPRAVVAFCHDAFNLRGDLRGEQLRAVEIPRYRADADVGVSCNINNGHDA